MTSLVSTLLAGPSSFIPPAGNVRRCQLANWETPVGSDDTDDGSFSSFADFIANRHPVTQERLLRMAWAIRRTGVINNFEMCSILDVDTKCISKLWNPMLEQKWVVAERRKGMRHGLFYRQTELGKKIFANAGANEQQAA